MCQLTVNVGRQGFYIVPTLSLSTDTTALSSSVFIRIVKIKLKGS